MNIDLSKYPLPEGYEFDLYSIKNRQKLGKFDGVHMPHFGVLKSSDRGRYCIWLNSGIELKCRDGSSSKNLGTPNSIEEALQFMSNFMMMGMHNDC